MGDPAATIAVGRAALAEGAWRRAQDAFEASLGEADSADAHAGLAAALWWLGALDDAIAHRERAYALFRKAAQPYEAFECALHVMLDYQGHVGNFTASSGWLARTERLVDEHRLDDVRGWLDLVRSGEEGDPADREQDARAALAAARETGDTDLELCALSRLGHRIVEQGRIEEGMAYLDEAMAGSLAGEGESRGTVVLASCNMMVSCIGAADFDRAVQWIRTADRFTSEWGCPFLYAECRTIYGVVLHSTGDWDRAEEELRQAIAASAGTVPVMHAQALAALAHLRLTQGRLAEARRLVAGIEDHPWAVPVVARIHLASGRIDSALALIRRREQTTPAGMVEIGNLLEVLGEAEVARGDAPSALDIGQRLRSFGDQGRCEVLAVRGLRLEGRALLAQGRHDPARERLLAAVEGFRALGMTYEAARTGVLLAASVIDTGRDVAIAELRACFTTFDALGARIDADDAARLLRDLGEATPPRRRSGATDDLTTREQEVLDLLAEGLSNPEIAERLFVSRKTVEHHVARVLSKLGVRNRTEAAAEAIRRLGSAHE